MKLVLPKGGGPLSKRWSESETQDPQNDWIISEKQARLIYLREHTTSWKMLVQSLQKSGNLEMTSAILQHVFPQFLIQYDNIYAPREHQHRSPLPPEIAHVYINIQTFYSEITNSIPM